MSKEDIRVPDLGGADAVEVIEISVAVGDTVAEEDSILVVESDKATVELPSPYAGKICELKVSVGDRISEGDLVGFMDVEAEASGKDEPQAEPETDDASAPANDEDGQEASQKGRPSGGGSRTEIIKVPDIGGTQDVPIIEILVKAGDVVDVEDPLVTLESYKASMDVPSPFAGTVGKVLVKEGDTVSEGHDLVEMTLTEAGGEQDDESEQSEPPQEAVPEPKTPAPEPAPKPKQPEPAAREDDEPTSGGRIHAGPAVRKLARELGVELPRVNGSGPKSRITKDDVQAYVKQQLKTSQGGVAQGSVTGAGLPSVKLPDFSKFGEIERKAMSRLHSLTADSMQRSWLNVPHVTQFEEADITELEAFRKAKKADGEKQGVKITPLPFMLKACAYALKALPAFNVALDMDKREVIQKHYVHIGIAVDTPNGLVVPVIRDVDRKGIWDLAREAQELAAKARDGKLTGADMQGGCFTITSLGGIGGTAFTPIVNTPEVAILGLSRADLKPVWDGSAFQSRLMLPLSLSYDHRAVNGAEAARFTNLLKQLLEDMRELMM